MKLILQSVYLQHLAFKASHQYRPSHIKCNIQERSRSRSRSLARSFTPTFQFIDGIVQAT